MRLGRGRGLLQRAKPEFGFSLRVLSGVDRRGLLRGLSGRRGGMSDGSGLGGSDCGLRCGGGGGGGGGLLSLLSLVLTLGLSLGLAPLALRRLLGTTLPSLWVVVGLRSFLGSGGGSGRRSGSLRSGLGSLGDSSGRSG